MFGQPGSSTSQSNQHNHQLKADALGLGDTVVLAMASSGPTQSIAASLAK